MPCTDTTKAADAPATDCCAVGTAPPAAETPRPAAAPINVTLKAAEAVKRIIEEQRQQGLPHDKVYLRLRTLGGGCSGLQDKLDLDPDYNPARDNLFDFHGVPVVVDKRSLLYLDGVTVDYHNELNRSGFSITNPNRKTTCGCGSSYSM